MFFRTARTGFSCYDWRDARFTHRQLGLVAISDHLYMTVNLPKFIYSPSLPESILQWVRVEGKLRALVLPSAQPKKKGNSVRLWGFFLKDHAHDGYLGSNPYSRMLTDITLCLNKLDDKVVYGALVELGLKYRKLLLTSV